MAPSSSNPGDPDLGFHPKQAERGIANCNDDAQGGNDVKDAAIVRHDRSRRDFHRQSHSPTLQLAGSARWRSESPTVGTSAGDLQTPLADPSTHRRSVENQPTIDRSRDPIYGRHARRSHRPKMSHRRRPTRKDSLAPPPPWAPRTWAGRRRASPPPSCRSPAPPRCPAAGDRSEERRVGKECRL